MCEARRQSDLDQRRVRHGKFTGGKFDPKMANVLAERTPEMFAERARKMRGMNVNRPRHAGET